MIDTKIDLNTYLNDGYFDENGKPRRELYIEWAEAIANKLAEKQMTRVAIRRFYNLIKGLETLLKDKQSFENEKHRLYPIVPLANYAITKDEQKLPEEFKTFVERNINEAEKSHKHFQAFVGHFQSVIAYFPAESKGGSYK